VLRKFLIKFSLKGKIRLSFILLWTELKINVKILNKSFDIKFLQKDMYVTLIIGFEFLKSYFKAFSLNQKHSIKFSSTAHQTIPKK
jgi:hypothetical protein